MTDTEFANDWLTRYGVAWARRDAVGAAALFASDAAYHVTPFSAPLLGSDAIRAYWTVATSKQTDIHFRFTIHQADGERVVAGWRTSYHSSETKAAVDLDGIFLLRFDAGGRCSELREWWHRRENADSK